MHFFLIFFPGRVSLGGGILSTATATATAAATATATATASSQAGD
jgi:hypothetical protein